MKPTTSTGEVRPNMARRVVMFMLVVSLPFVAFGVWMVVIGAYGLAAAWFVSLVAGTAVFIRLMLRALASKERG
jgi:hypothetical protein